MSLCQTTLSTDLPRVQQALSSHHLGSLCVSSPSCTGTSSIICQSILHRLFIESKKDITMIIFPTPHHRQPKVSPVFHKENKVRSFLCPSSQLSSSFLCLTSQLSMIPSLSTSFFSAQVTPFVHHHNLHSFNLNLRYG